MRQMLAGPWLVLALLAAVAHDALGQADLIVKITEPSASSGLVLRGAVGKVSPALQASDPLLAGVLEINPVFVHPGATRVGKASELDNVFRLTVSDSSALEVARAIWSGREDVEYAIQNHRYQLETLKLDAEYNDTHFDSLTHLELIRATEAWQITNGVPSIRIGLIDTGVFKTHPDLQSQFWVNEPEDLNGNGILDEGDLNDIDDDGNGYVDDVVGYDFVDRTGAVDQGDYLVRDPDASEDRLDPSGQRRGGFGHGTLVAGVVSAALDNGLGIAGVAPGARLVPIRAFGIDGLAEDDDVAAAIVFAADEEIDVVNLSFGDTYYSPLMADAVRYAISRGTTVVASGGNVGTDAPHYPSDYPDVIGALWLDRDGERRGSRASFGIGIDVGAPGSFVFTTLMPPPDDLVENPQADSVLYGYRSGSSLAAPQISGAVALLRSLDPGLTPASMKAILTGTAHDLGDPGWDHATASGRVDIAAALGLPYPAVVAISYPPHDAGFAGRTVEISGSILTPLFDSYSVWYGFERENEAPDWQLISGPNTTQRRDEPLATWNLDSLPDSTYILRLEVQLKNGQTIEDRRRIYVDRTPPDIRLIMADAALFGPFAGVQIELVGDDFSTARMSIHEQNRTHVVSSDRAARRHGHALSWIDRSGSGGEVEVSIEVSNSAGLTTTLEPISLFIPPMPNPSYLEEVTEDLPAGYLLPKPTDLDVDGLPEVVFNRYREGWLGDTVRVSEWAGDRFRTAGDILSNTFPRDTGDSDFDGNPEILLQVSAVTQVIEFSDRGQEAEVIFLDTAGIDNPSSDAAAWGAALTDLDGDRRGEIVVHNRKVWRLLEFGSGGYTEVARLQNPTPLEEATASGLLGTEANGFAEPQALAGDFDRDGRGDLLVNDSDGDFIVFESTGDNTYQPVWYHLTPRFNNLGTRLAEGDFDGDGNREFVGYTHPWPDPRQDGDYDAPYGIYYLFGAFGDDDYRVIDSLIVAGEVSNHGSIAAIDFDGDDADEIVIAHPPNVYVLTHDPEVRWRVLFQRGDLGTEMVSGIRSISMTPGDFDLDGIPDILIAGADQQIHRFEWSSTGSQLPAPTWISATAINDSSVRLAWRTGTSDSVAVYKRKGSGAFDLVGVTNAGFLVDSTSSLSSYALIAYYGSARSELSKGIEVRPHAPAELESAEWRGDLVAFVFSETLPQKLEAGLFSLGGGQIPSSAQTSGSGNELMLRFAPAPVEGDTIFWPELTDAERTPVRPKFGIVPMRPETGLALFLKDWNAVSATRAALTFSLPLDPIEAVKTDNYRVDPNGTVAAVGFDPTQPERVLVDVVGRALGATGLRTSIVVEEMTAQDGTRLASEGTVATFVSAAENLSGAYIFPNPYRSDLHEASVMIAGLPNRTTIQIYSSTGAPITTLEESDGDGGVAWDLTDDSGMPVKSGVYIVRVVTETDESVILKSAVIR